MLKFINNYVFFVNNLYLYVFFERFLASFSISNRSRYILSCYVKVLFFQKKVFNWSLLFVALFGYFFPYFPIKCVYCFVGKKFCIQCRSAVTSWTHNAATHLQGIFCFSQIFGKSRISHQNHGYFIVFDDASHHPIKHSTPFFLASCSFKNGLEIAD